MGREAHCLCRWGSRTAKVTALLESSELILRGELRERVPLTSIRQVTASGDALEFTAAGERIALVLGAAAARRWAQAIAVPPPDLAQKLGLTAATRVHIIGTIDDPELATALTRTSLSADTPERADLVVIRTDDSAQLAAAVAAVLAGAAVPPVWIVYVKGRAAPLGERTVRDLLRDRGFIDTKVASVSGRLTALRFTKRS
jgi:hypothetical protein